MRTISRQLSTLFAVLVAAACWIATERSRPDGTPLVSSPPPPPRVNWDSKSYQDVALMAAWLEMRGVDYWFEEETGSISVDRSDEANLHNALESDELRGFWYSDMETETAPLERKTIVKKRTRDWLEWRTDDEIEKLWGLSPAIIRVNPTLLFDGESRALKPRPIPATWPVPCQPESNIDYPFQLVKTSVIIFVPENPEMFDDDISWSLGVEPDKGDLQRIFVVGGKEKFLRVCRWARSQRELELRRRPPWNGSFNESAQ